MWKLERALDLDIQCVVLDFRITDRYCTVKVISPGALVMGHSLAS